MIGFWNFKRRLVKTCVCWPYASIIYFFLNCPVRPKNIKLSCFLKTTPYALWKACWRSMDWINWKIDKLYNIFIQPYWETFTQVVKPYMVPMKDKNLCHVIGWSLEVQSWIKHMTQFVDHHRLHAKRPWVDNSNYK